MSKPKILVIDDSRMIRATAAKILGNEFSVVQAESGESGWAEINTDPEILTVFCDLSMPGLDGFELLQQVRADEREPVARLPMIILTGNAEDEAREQALELGATDFVTKPFEAAQLLARARAHATHDKLRRQTAALQESQTQDTMTGLGNARYFSLRLKSNRAYSVRHALPMALIRLDLLGLNERARQHNRDTMVRTVHEAGRALAHHVREEDVLVHMAPGRFAVISPNCDHAGADSLTRRLLDTVLDTQGAPAQLGVGASAAFYVPDPSAELTLQTIHETAQQAADEARAQGSGGLVRMPEAELPADDRATAPATAAADDPPSLDEALAMLDEGRETARLQQHWPALLEQCARLFEAAPNAVTRPILERLESRKAQVGESARTG